MKPADVPPVRVKYWRGKQWREVPDGPDWIFLGIAPTPQTTWQALLYHILHGLIMRYPIADVLRWSWRNRHSFMEVNEMDEQQEEGER